MHLWLAVLAAGLWAGQAQESAKMKAVPVAQEPSHKLMLENEWVRVYSVTLAPGEATLPHRHDRDYVTVWLDDGKAGNKKAGEPGSQKKVKAGGVDVVSGGFQHVVSNQGDKAWRNVTVELQKGSGREWEVKTVTLKKAESTGRHGHQSGHLAIALGDLHLINVIDDKRLEIRQKAGGAAWIGCCPTHELRNAAKTDAKFVTLTPR